MLNRLPSVGLGITAVHTHRHHALMVSMGLFVYVIKVTSISRTHILKESGYYAQAGCYVNWIGSHNL